MKNHAHSALDVLLPVATLSNNTTKEGKGRNALWVGAAGSGGWVRANRKLPRVMGKSSCVDFLLASLHPQLAGVAFRHNSIHLLCKPEVHSNIAHVQGARVQEVLPFISSGTLNGFANPITHVPTQSTSCTTPTATRTSGPSPTSGSQSGGCPLMPPPWHPMLTRPSCPSR